MIYVDSTVFVLASSTVVHGLGINSSREVCEGGILLCKSGLSRDIDPVVLILLGLVCYMTTKIIIYYFLVERAVSSPQFLPTNQS
jgi:hypothetical protein